jgi:hypothetical protein
LYDRTHAERKIKKKDHIQRLLFAGEVHDGLEATFVEHTEVILGQTGQGTPVQRNFGIHVNQGHAGTKHGSVLRGEPGGAGQRRTKS